MTDVTTDRLGKRPRFLTHLVAMRCERALYEAIEREAVKERRTVSGWVRMVVEQRLAAEVPK